MNFFACPILVMNLVFRHDEQEEEVMSRAEEVCMQPSSQSGFVDQLIEFQQGSFFTHEEISPEHESFAEYVGHNQMVTVGETPAGNLRYLQGEVGATPMRVSGKGHEGKRSNLSPMKPHLRQGPIDSGERQLRQEKGRVYVPPHRKVNPGWQRDASPGGRQRDVHPDGLLRDTKWRKKIARFEQQVPVQKHQAHGFFERTVNFNRSLPVGQNHKRGDRGEQSQNCERVGTGRENVIRLVDCQRTTKSLIIDCEDREGKSEEENRHCGRNKAAEKTRPRQQGEEAAVVEKPVEEAKSLRRSRSSGKDKLGESKNKVDMKESVRESLETSLSARKSSKDKSVSEKKKSSGKKKGRSSAKRSQLPENPLTLSSKSIEDKCRTTERMDRSYNISSGYSSARKQSKPVLRLTACSEVDSSPTLPRTPSTPWNLADESCCAEPDTFSSASHSLPGYKICRKELGVGSVWDSHCHLDFLATRKLNSENIKGGESLKMSLQTDGQQLGEKFGGCIANFCDPKDWAQGSRSQEVSKILTSCKEQSGVFLTLGCHPHFADKMDGFSVQQLQKLAMKMKGRVVAIGECGLDKSGKNRVPMKIQKKYFEAQIDIARELDLPLVLHIRGAEEEAMELLKKKKVPANFRIHYHCFTGTWKSAEAWLSAYPASKIGLTGLVTFDHAKSVHEVARHIPLDKLLLETDAPYFLPSGVSKESYRHTFSQPGHVVHVAAQVSNLRR